MEKQIRKDLTGQVVRIKDKDKEFGGKVGQIIQVSSYHDDIYPYQIRFTGKDDSTWAIIEWFKEEEFLVLSDNPLWKAVYE